MTQVKSVASTTGSGIRRIISDYYVCYMYIYTILHSSCQQNNCFHNAFLIG